MIILADKEGVNAIRVLIDAAVEKGVFKNLRQAVAIASCVRELPPIKTEGTEQATSPQQQEKPEQSEQPAEGAETCSEQ